METVDVVLGIIWGIAMAVGVLLLAVSTGEMNSSRRIALACFIFATFAATGRALLGSLHLLGFHTILPLYLTKG